MIETNDELFGVMKAYPETILMQASAEDLTWLDNALFSSTVDSIKWFDNAQYLNSTNSSLLAIVAVPQKRANNALTYFLLITSTHFCNLPRVEALEVIQCWS